MKRIAAAVLLVVEASAGCAAEAGSAASSAAALSVRGGVDGAGAVGDAIVLWSVSSGSPDYLYAFGSGTASGPSFAVSLPTEPPAEAINAYGVGVGTVIVVPAGMLPARGQLDDGALDSAMLLAFSARHGIIWRDGSLSGLGWPDAFPEGYGCGKCVPTAAIDCTMDAECPVGMSCSAETRTCGGASSFDSYAPEPCDEIELTTDPNVDPCDWT